MSATFLESVPASELEAIKIHFEHFGTVNIGGLLENTDLGAAASGARDLARGPKTFTDAQEHCTFAEIRPPTSNEHPALQRVIEAAIEGAAIVGYDLVATGKERQIYQLQDRDKNMIGMKKVYRATQLGVVATVALEGKAFRSVEDSESGKIMDYGIEAGDVFIQETARQLPYRDYTGMYQPQLALSIVRHQLTSMHISNSDVTPSR